MALSEPQRTPFERIRQVDEDGLEFWSARDLMRVLEYTDWRNFKGVLIKGQIACENSGHDPTDHFVGASKMVSLGSDAKREVEDMHLSRYACYLMCKTPILPKKSSCNGPHNPSLEDDSRTTNSRVSSQNELQCCNTHYQSQRAA